MFQVSDKIVLVDSKGIMMARGHFTSIPRKGKVYVVRSVRIGTPAKLRYTKTKGYGISLVGIVGDIHPTRGNEVCWCGERFRKLSEVKEENSTSNNVALPA